MDKLDGIKWLVSTAGTRSREGSCSEDMASEKRHNVTWCTYCVLGSADLKEAQGLDESLRRSYDMPTSMSVSVCKFNITIISLSLALAPLGSMPPVTATALTP